MATKKYLVRAGFIVALALRKEDGSGYERTYNAGEEVTLDDEQAALHLHKLEFASQKDRDAALAAEKDAMVARAAQQSPVDLVAALTKALAQQLAANQPPATPAV